LINNEGLLKSHGWIYDIMTKGYSLEQSENGIWIHFHGGGLRLSVNWDDVDDIDKYIQRNYADRIQLQFMPHNGMEHLKQIVTDFFRNPYFIVVIHCPFYQNEY
jgi:hypothetical protein